MFIFKLLCFALAHVAAASDCLVATAVVSEPDGIARIECWEFVKQFNEYPTVGAAMTLANTSNVTYVVLPPRSGEGIHKPPSAMLFVLVSGLAHVTLPYGDDEVWIVEGVNGVLVAADTTGIGHYTDYPSDKETVALQLPFADGKMPEHTILHSGACKTRSQLNPCSQAELSDDLRAAQAEEL